MKLPAAALLAAVAATPAFSASQDVRLTASVESRCTISDSVSPAALVQDLVVNENGFISTAPVQVSFPVYCNTPSTLILSSANKGMTGPNSANFAKVVHYSVRLTGPQLPMFGMYTAEYFTMPDGSSMARDNNTAGINGNLTLVITPVANTTPLASGIYSDTVTLTIVPQQ